MEKGQKYQMKNIIEWIVAFIALLIYIPVFLVFFVLGLFGFKKMKYWCESELNFWERCNDCDIQEENGE